MRRKRTWLIAALLVVALALAALWSQRRPIASGYANRFLAERKVPARYRIAELGLGRQRFTDLVIGDPARPDLVADWVETETGYGLSGPFIASIRAGRVRLRGRLVGGRVSLGAIDRLLPAPSGAPFTLPAYDLTIADGRLRLDTPAGVVGVKLSGAGKLDDGFRGTVAVVGDGLRAGACETGRASFYGTVAIAAAAPRLTGPLRIDRAQCDDIRAREARAALDVRFGPALDRWEGNAAPAIAEVRGGQLWLKRLGGRLDFAGSVAGTGGRAALTAGPSAAYGASAVASRVDGRFRLGGRTGFDGTVAAERAILPARWRGLAAGLTGSAPGTPVGPLIDRLGSAAGAAMRDLTLGGSLAIDMEPAGLAVRLRSAEARSASGASLTLAGGRGIAVGPGGTLVDGRLAMAGGGLPEGTVALAQVPGGGLNGVANLRPYQAGTARLALSAVSFGGDGGAIRLSTRATLSGPLGDGRLDGATLPLTARWDGGRLRVNPGCAPFTFERLRVAGLALGRTTTRLCPVGPAMLALDGGRIGGGVQMPATRLAGRLGGSPLTLAWRRARVAFDSGRFTLSGLDTALGDAARRSVLTVADLSGGTADGGLGGRFAGAAGQIGNVPLLVGAAAGDWTFRGGRLVLDGTASVRDAAEQPRFEPLAARDLRLTLADSRIAVTGWLATPAQGAKVADVTIAHDLTRGTGQADLTVPGLVFGPTLQPEAITRLTFGVIADVAGTVSGRGQIRWTPDGVASDGRFATQGLDFAAAFGPVTGVKGDIAFTDLLALESAPGQVATVASVNPGVPVNDGTIRFQTLAGARVRVEGGRWPFAGGELLLDPALLDFSAPMERRMTFRVRALDAGQFLQTFDYKNLSATGTFDGVLPMVFDERGGRIENGRLSVREGGGTIAYAGEVSRENLGLWGNIAFQALRSLRYRSLGIVMNGPLAGEMVTEVRFAGISQGEGAKANFLVKRIARLPFVFNVRITAPFRALIDSARSFYDPSRLIERNLPALIEEQNRRAGERPSTAIQPPESGNKP